MRDAILFTTSALLGACALGSGTREGYVEKNADTSCVYNIAAMRTASRLDGLASEAWFSLINEIYDLLDDNPAFLVPIEDALIDVRIEALGPRDTLSEQALYAFADGRTLIEPANHAALQASVRLARDSIWSAIDDPRAVLTLLQCGDRVVAVGIIDLDFEPHQAADQESHWDARWLLRREWDASGRVAPASPEGPWRAAGGGVNISEIVAVDYRSAAQLLMHILADDRLESPWGDWVHSQIERGTYAHAVFSRARPCFATYVTLDDLRQHPLKPAQTYFGVRGDDRQQAAASLRAWLNGSAHSSR